LHKITDKTKAIIAVSIFGQPCDFDRINAIAKKYNLVVIEDAAQSIGATYKGKYSGTLSDMGVFSLNRHKHINCGEGSIICTDNDDLAFKLRLLLNHSEAVCNDMERKGENIPDGCVGLVGMNLRGTELSAAIAREQLKKLDGILEKYREDAKYFPVKVRENCVHSYYRYAFYEGTITPEMQEKFNYKGGYITPIYKMPLFRHLGYGDVLKKNCIDTYEPLCPVCEEVNDNIVLAWQKVSY
jgi:dTDP-4-amino-4,6-dideoxygalactose transaminase